jgi:hypothetical protein
MNTLKSLTLALCGGLAMFAMSANAEEAPSWGAMETFACNYNDGKDRDDLLAARDYYVKQAAKAGVKLAPSYLWSAFKGNTPDIVWLTPHVGGLTAFAKQAADENVPELSGVSARFDAVGECTAGLSAVRTLFQGSTPLNEDSPTTFVNTNRCSFQAGHGPSSLPGLRAHINDALGRASEFNAFVAYIGFPTTRSQGDPDLYIFGVNNDIQEWAAGQQAFVTSPDLQALGRHFDTVLECDSALWIGEQVIEGAE